jgi:hypothetical protein
MDNTKFKKKTNAYAHSLDTRNKNQLYLPVVS